MMSKKNAVVGTFPLMILLSGTRAEANIIAVEKGQFGVGISKNK